MAEKTGDPKALLEQTRAGIEAKMDFEYAYGLCKPVATPGEHPWLRDSLAGGTVKGPGDAQPDYDIDTPFDKGVDND